MQLDNVARRLETFRREQGIAYTLGNPTSEAAIAEAERRLGVTLPAQVRAFYERYNGLLVAEPHAEILPVERLEYTAPHRLRFAIMDHTHDLYFDTSHTNPARQWDIVTKEGYRVTFTMASLWSNRLWAWVIKRRGIWVPEHR